MNKPAKMRSSIACVRCRRSKVKCVNNGIETTCRTCETQGRECTYPSPAISASLTPKREATSGLGDGDVKRARKREPDASRKQSIKDVGDPLESPPITFKMWKDIYNFFVLHFSTDLPFLHEATFFDRIRKAQTSESRDSETQMFLLGILSLTARFVPELVNYNYPVTHPSRPGDPRPGEPLYASEFYARALQDRLDSVTMATQSLDTIQALLMLSVHSWGMLRGMRSWMWIGTATRMAYAMGLSSEDDSDLTRKDPALAAEAKLLGVKEKPKAPSDTQSVINREIRRRTMWSCFILDRFQSSGRARPQMNVETLGIQLPCSEEDFRFGSNVATEFLLAGGGVLRRGSSSDRSHLIQVDTSPVLSIYIRLVEMWSEFSRWSCAGGRREEKFPPWDERSTFYKLRKRLEEFQATLPPKLTLTPSNLAAHVGGTAMSVYTSIHTLYSLCRIVLHREYIPFIPIRCSEGPSGPLDEPTFPKETVPLNFWEESAEQLFKAARDITDIIKANSGRGYLIESPPITFAIWTAAFVGIYATIFPWMDQSHYMCDLQGHKQGGEEATQSAIDALDKIGPKMRMADKFGRMIRRLHKYMQGIVKGYENSQHSQLLLDLSNGLNGAGSNPSRKLSLREGGLGGGLAEYKLIEKQLKEFGTIDEDDEPSGSDRHERGSSRASTGGPAMTPNIKQETMPGIERSSVDRPNSEGTWAAVNTGPLSGSDIYGQRNSTMYKSFGTSGQTGTNGRQNLTYEQQGSRGLPPNTPSFLSPQTTQATPVSINSSFGQPALTGAHPSEHVYSHGTQPLHQMAEFPSSAQHTHPLPGSTPDPLKMGVWQEQNHDDAWLQELESISFGGADLAIYRDAMPYDSWAANDTVNGYPTNFIAATLHSVHSAYM